MTPSHSPEEIVFKSKHLKVINRSSHGVFVKDRQSLIAFDEDECIAFAGGKFEQVDNYNSYNVVLRETGEEVGTKLEYRLALAQPLVFCTDPEKSILIPDDRIKTGHEVDLRFFYLFLVTGGEVEEREPDKFRSPQFVDQRFFHNRQKGKDIRHSPTYAMKFFQHLECWPRVPVPQTDLEPDYVHIRKRLASMGFSKKFAHRYSRNHQKPPPDLVPAQQMQLSAFA